MAPPSAAQTYSSRGGRLGENCRDSKAAVNAPRNQQNVHQRHPVRKEPFQLPGNSERGAKANQIVDPVTPELDASEDPPEQATDHQADYHKDEQDRTDERRPFLDENLLITVPEAPQPGTATFIAHRFLASCRARCDVLFAVTPRSLAKDYAPACPGSIDMDQSGMLSRFPLSPAEKTEGRRLILLGDDEKKPPGIRAAFPACRVGPAQVAREVCWPQRSCSEIASPPSRQESEPQNVNVSSSFIISPVRGRALFSPPCTVPTFFAFIRSRLLVYALAGKGR